AEVPPPFASTVAGMARIATIASDDNRPTLARLPFLRATEPVFEPAPMWMTSVGGVLGFVGASRPEAQRADGQPDAADDCRDHRIDRAGRERTKGLASGSASTAPVTTGSHHAPPGSPAPTAIAILAMARSRR